MVTAKVTMVKAKVTMVTVMVTVKVTGQTNVTFPSEGE